MKKILTVTVFAVIIFSVFFASLILPSDDFSQSERRALAAFPEISEESVLNGEFSQGFEEYATDRIVLRDTLRRIKAIFSYTFLGKKDNNGLFVAQGHLSKLDPKQNDDMINHAVQRFNNLREKYLKDKNTKIYLSLIPDKNFVLAEKNGYPSLDYSAFIKSVREKLSYMEYIDINDLLSADDYYKTDSHWRQEKITDIAERLGEKMGTDVSAEYEVKKLNTPFWGVYAGQSALPVPSEEIYYLTNETLSSAVVTYYDTGTPKEGEMYNMEKAFGKDAYEMFLSGASPIITMQNQKVQNGKKLIIFRDSYASSLAPLLLEGYEQITLVDIRYIKSDFVGHFVDFENSDVLFMYSTTLINNSLALG